MDEIIIKYTAELDGIKADFKQLQSEVKAVETKSKESADSTTKNFKSAGDSIKTVALDIAASLGLAFSVAKVIDFARESIKAFQESEAVAKKLEFAITRIGKEGSAAFEKLTKQADALSKITIFDDESIRGSQTMLAQFGLQSKEIEKLIPKIIDLASATGQDLNSATQLAIAGINGQGRALKPYGIILDDTGDKTKNLALVTEGLAKFTGSAGEAFNTAAGQAKFFDNQINELQESIGQKLSPVWEALKISALNSINEQLEAFEDLKNVITGNNTTEDQAQRLFEKFQQLSEEAQLKDVARLVALVSKRTDLQNKELILFHEFLEKKRAAAQVEESQELGLTQKGIDEKAAKQKKAADDELEANKKESDKNYDIFKAQQAKREKDAEDEAALKKKLAKEVADAEIDAAKDAYEEAKRLQEKLDEDQKEALQKAHDTQVEIATTAVNAIFDYANQKADVDEQKRQEAADRNIERIQAEVDAGVRTEESGAAAIKVIRDNLDAQSKQAAKEKAKRDKAQAAFNIGIATAEAIVKALAVPPPAGEILAASIAILGGIQLAAVLAKPLPLAKGAIDLRGGIEGKDSIPALLMPHESVMRADITQKHGGLLKSLHENRFDQYLLENYINPAIGDILRQNSTAGNMAKSAKLNFPDEYALSRVMRRNKGVNIQNVDYMARAIAREMKSGNVKRTWSA